MVCVFSNLLFHSINILIFYLNSPMFSKLKITRTTAIASLMIFIMYLQVRKVHFRSQLWKCHFNLDGFFTLIWFLFRIHFLLIKASLLKE